MVVAASRPSPACCHNDPPRRADGDPLADPAHLKENSERLTSVGLPRNRLDGLCVGCWRWLRSELGGLDSEGAAAFPQDAGRDSLHAALTVADLGLECSTVFPWAHFEAFPEAPVKVSDVLEAAGPGDAGNRFLGVNEIL